MKVVVVWSVVEDESGVSDAIEVRVSAATIPLYGGKCFVSFGNRK